MRKCVQVYSSSALILEYFHSGGGGRTEGWIWGIHQNLFKRSSTIRAVSLGLEESPVKLPLPHLIPHHHLFANSTDFNQLILREIVDKETSLMQGGKGLTLAPKEGLDFYYPHLHLTQ